MSYLRPQVRRGMGSLSSGPRGPRIASIALSDDPAAAAPTSQTLPDGKGGSGIIITDDFLDPRSYLPKPGNSGATSTVKIAAIAAIALLAYKFIAR